MKALFSSDRRLVGWIDPGHAIFDAEMNYVAFVANENAWSVEGSWLGAVHVVTLCDRSGRPVAWNPEHVPSAVVRPAPLGRPSHPKRPMRPKRPLPPMRPIMPKAPLGGWSPLSFEEWLCPVNS